MTPKGSVKRRTGSWLVKFRAEFLAAHPLCERCQKHSRIKLATQVDHRKSLGLGGDDFDVNPGNAQALCAACHLIKTAEDFGHTPPVPPHPSWPGG